MIRTSCIHNFSFFPCFASARWGFFVFISGEFLFIKKKGVPLWKTDCILIKENYEEEGKEAN